VLRLIPVDDPDGSSALIIVTPSRPTILIAIVIGSGFGALAERIASLIVAEQR
jgi:hypothetical protein